MTEAEAREWIRERFGVSRETMLATYADLLVAEAGEQNLISGSTIDALWSRHLVDSAQLIPLAEGADGTWLDIGSGAGLPGLVVAILTDRPVVLAEPRSRRVAFLEACISTLGIADRVTIWPGKSETLRQGGPFSVISARAVAELPKLFAGALHLANADTLWVLPKGRNAQSEVAAARRVWQGSFHVEPSITQSDSGIVIARGVRPK